jgi:hypothetical protein
VRRLTLALLTTLVAMPPSGAHAQIIRGRFGLRDPQTWVSATVGWQNGWTVFDGETSSRWELGDSQAYGGSIERIVANSVSLGLRASTATPTVRYTDASAPDLVRVADTRVTQALGIVHVSTGRDVRSVFELGLGTTIYSDFRERATDLRLGPAKTDLDFAFMFVYGLGYSFTRNFHVDVVQDWGNSIHQKSGLVSGEDTSARISSTRLVARYGFGG